MSSLSHCLRECLPYSDFFVLLGVVIIFLVMFLVGFAIGRLRLELEKCPKCGEIYTPKQLEI